jgi:membrane-bound lytic murein transglycosylase F
MQPIKKDYIKFYLLILILIFSLICIFSRYPHKALIKKDFVYDWKEIKERDTLYVTTGYNSISYFIYRGQPMGFQYEMINHLANALNINVQVIVSNDMKSSFEMLRDGRCDIIAVDLSVTKERSEEFSFTLPHSQTRQVLVQAKPPNWEKISRKTTEKYLIRNQTEMANTYIHIPTNTSFKSRIQSLSDEIGAPIHIVELPGIGSEQLIEKVATYQIQYTVCDEHLAAVNGFYYNNIDYSTPISFKQNLSWAVRKTSPVLLKKINNWLDSFTQSIEYEHLYNKYYRNPRSVEIFESEFFSGKSNKISDYDSLMKVYAKDIDWDWLLLASLIFEESRFNHDLYSWAGAYGLMQLMPVTAKRFGAPTPSNPEDNIRAGTQYIKWLDEHFQEYVPNKEERIKFIIAAYNIGHNHIIDAINLTKKYGDNPARWDEVKEYFLLKSNPKYYRDPVVKYGYCRGTSSARMVENVLNRYKNYKILYKN